MTPPGLIEQLRSEIGIPCEIRADQTYQPFVCRQDHLRELVQRAYDAGRASAQQEKEKAA